MSTKRSTYAWGGVPSCGLGLAQLGRTSRKTHRGRPVQAKVQHYISAYFYEASAAKGVQTFAQVQCIILKRAVTAWSLEWRQSRGAKGPRELGADFWFKPSSRERAAARSHLDGNAPDAGECASDLRRPLGTCHRAENSRINIPSRIPGQHNAKSLSSSRHNSDLPASPSRDKVVLWGEAGQYARSVRQWAQVPAEEDAIIWGR